MVHRTNDEREAFQERANLLRGTILVETILRALDLNEPFARQPPARRRRGEAAARGLTIADVHLLTNLAHGVDDFVGRNGERDAGERHLDRGKRDRCSSRVAKNARQLDETAERVADETECP